MEHNYLIPANSKKSMLILGFFTPIDLIVFGIGSAFSVIMLFIFNTTVNLSSIVLMLLPAIISAFLVMPVPNYHNMMQLITNIIIYFSGRKRYYWKGWCFKDE